MWEKEATIGIMQQESYQQEEACESRVAGSGQSR